MNQRMTFRLMILVAILFLSVLAVGGVTRGQEASLINRSSAFVPNELLIGVRSEQVGDLRLEQRVGRVSTGLASLDALNYSFSVQEVSAVFADLAGDELAMTYGLPGILKLTFPVGTDLFAALAAYQHDPAVRYAELNRVYVSFDIPDDPDFGQQWALHNTGQSGGRDDADIDASEAWDVNQGSADVLIAIVDTGVNYTHEDLDGGRVRTDIDRDFINDDDDAMDDHGHGTFVAGIIGADTNNGVGIAGICRNCQILPVKVLNGDGSGSAESVSQGIQYAAEQGADVINMSLGFPSDCGCSQTVAGALNYAYDKGSFLVAASGNDSDKTRTSYPASSPRVMAVGASDRNDAEADFSNRDSYLDIMAPGVDIYSLDNTSSNSYTDGDGTSAASPHVAGVAGLVLATHGDLSNAALWYRLYQSADDFPAVARQARQINEPVDLSTFSYHIFLPGVNSLRQTFGRLNARSAVDYIGGGEMFNPVDICSGEPSCTPGCAAEVALSSQPSFAAELALLRKFRDTKLAVSTTGADLIARYDENRLETAYLLATNSDLRAEARAVLGRWIPVVTAIVHPGEAGAVVISAELLDTSLTLTERMITMSSAGMVDDLRVVRSYLQEGYAYIGRDATTAWASWTSK